MDSLRHAVPDALLGDGEEGGCRCETAFADDRLVVDASGCPDGGRLATSERCRATVVRRLAERDVEAIAVHDDSLERVYDGTAVALLVAAGRFLDAVALHDERLAERAASDPLGATREAVGRADAVADIAARVGLGEVAGCIEDYETGLAPQTGLTVSDWRVDTAVPAGASLRDRRDLDTGSTARIYAIPDGRDRYELSPAGHDLGAASRAALDAAYERLASGRTTGGDRAAGRAVRSVVEDGHVGSPSDVCVDRVTAVLEKHTHGHGLLADFFADPAVSDVFVTAPVPENPLMVRAGDRRLPTNVRLTERGVAALASRYRRESGRGFSRADPTLDAATEIRDRRIRVAAVTDPASDGTAFAFRAHDRDIWTLPALVANDTIPPGPAALLSLATERGSAILVAGPRGAGKSTLLGTLLWELPPAVRTVIIEDAPELPVGPLQRHGRDVQALRADDDTFTPTEALRTALRLGEGAIAVGEVRGEEAQVLYEAMRVGANDDAVLGTIHGDGADDVAERVVADLGVPPSSFGATDLVVSLEQTAGGKRRVRTIEEVIDADRFETLSARPRETLEATGRIDRGNSRLVEGLRHPGESYAEVREALSDRAEAFSTLAQTGRTGADAVNAVALERQA